MQLPERRRKRRSDACTVEPLFKDHPKSQANAILKERRSLVRDSFTWRYKGNVSEKKSGLKRGMVSHQGGLWPVVLLYTQKNSWANKISPGSEGWLFHLRGGTHDNTVSMSAIQNRFYCGLFEECAHKWLHFLGANWHSEDGRMPRGILVRPKPSYGADKAKHQNTPVQPRKKKLEFKRGLFVVVFNRASFFA